MTSKQIPRQPDFIASSEDWGKVILEDGTAIETRFVLADIVIVNEDVLGPSVVFNHVIAIRAKSPPDIIDKFKDKPLVEEKPMALTVEAGYEAVKISSVEKPTVSVYKFENYIMTVDVNIENVARNNNYKVPSGAPLYNIRWVLKYGLRKVESK